jgi:hypothetical protein
MRKQTMKIMSRMLIVLMIILMAACASAIQDPDLRQFFYTQNTKPAIDINFSTAVLLIKSDLTQGNSKFALTYENQSYLSRVLVNLQSPFVLVQNLPANPYVYIFNAKTNRGTQLDGDQIYFIVVDQTAPTISISPNNAFFSKTNDANLTFRIAFSERSRLNTVMINNDTFLDFNFGNYSTA